MTPQEIRKRIDRNREEINKILHTDLPPKLMNMRVKILASQNERLLDKLKTSHDTTRT